MPGKNPHAARAEQFTVENIVTFYDEELLALGFREIKLDIHE